MSPLISFALSLFVGTTSVDFDPVTVIERMVRFAPVTFYFQNRHEEATFALLDRTGAIKEEVLPLFSRFVRCWRTERVKPMHPRTVEIVAAVSRHFDGARVQIVSGYRAKPYGAPRSKHFRGRAMDISVDGVAAKKVADWIWLNFRNVGVGYYPRQGFVHVDTREQDVRWVDYAKHGEGATARYSGRSPKDALSPSAPQLAYDRDQTVAAYVAIR